MAKIRNEELDQLAGEILPERTVLSTVPADPSGGAPFSPFCSPNNQSNGVAGNVIAVVSASNQCGLTNAAHSDGVGIVTH